MDNNYQPVQPSIVRIVGVDSPKIDVSQSIKSTQLPKIADTTQQSFNAVDQSISDMTKAQQALLEGAAKAEATKAQSRGADQVGQQIASIAGTIMQGYDIINKKKAAQEALAQQQKELEAKQLDAYNKHEADIQAQALKAQQEQDKAQEDSTYSSVRSFVQNSLLDVQKNIRDSGYDQGAGVVRRNVEATIAYYEKNNLIKPENVRTLRDLMYSTLGEVEKTQTTRAVAQSDELLNQTKENKLQVARNQLTPYLSAVKGATSVEEANAALTSFNAGWKDIQKQYNLSDTEALPIYNALLKEVTDSTQVGTAARQQIARTLSDNQTYLDLDSALEQQVRQGFTVDSKGQQVPFTVNDKNRILAQARGALPNLASYAVGTVQTVTDELKDANGLIEQQEKLKNAAITQGKDDAFQQFQQLDSAVIGRNVYGLANDPSALSNFSVLAENDPTKKSLVNTTKEFLADSEKFNTLKQRIAATDTRIRSAISSVDPSTLPTDGKTSWLDTLAGTVREVNGEVKKDPTMSVEQYQAIKNERQALLDELVKIGGKWVKFGLDVGTPSSAAGLMTPEVIKEKQLQVQGISGIKIDGTANISVSAPRFNPGAVASGTPSAAPVNKIYKMNVGTTNSDAQPARPVALPFLIDSDEDAKDVQFGTGYGYEGRGRLHSGVDITMSRPSKVITIQGGTVISDAAHHSDIVDGGFGITVLVRTPDGRVEQFSHLKQGSVQVKPGQVIAPGTVLATTGNTGGDKGVSGGEHLHMNVWKAGVPDSTVMSLAGNEKVLENPYDYLANVNLAQSKPRGVGAQGRIPVNGSRPLALSPSILAILKKNNISPDYVGSGVQTQNVLVDPVTGVGTDPKGINNNATYSWDNKIARGADGKTSPNLADYPKKKNDPGASYGYAKLANQPGAMASLAKGADELGIPAVWLADLMQVETAGSFRPSIDNGLGFKGLIQFDKAMWFPYFGVTEAEVDRMSFAEQMTRMVIPYFKAIIKETGKPMRTIFDLKSAVWGGGGLYAKSHETRWQQNINDRAAGGNMDYRTYCKMLGSAAGRQYRY